MTGTIVIAALIILLTGSALLFLRPRPGRTGQTGSSRPATRFPDPTSGFRDPFRDPFR